MNQLSSKTLLKKKAADEQPSSDANQPGRREWRRLMFVSAILVIWILCLILMASLT